MIRQNKVLPAIYALLAGSAYAKTGDICEKIDGDCPDDCSAAGFTSGDLHFEAHLWIRPAPCQTEKMAWRAESYI